MSPLRKSPSGHLHCSTHLSLGNMHVLFEHVLSGQTGPQGSYTKGGLQHKSGIVYYCSLVSIHFYNLMQRLEPGDNPGPSLNTYSVNHDFRNRWKTFHWLIAPQIVSPSNHYTQFGQLKKSRKTRVAINYFLNRSLVISSSFKT